jgi:hypothetical protein
MITNVEYLIQKYAEAREKLNTYSSSESGYSYWKGSMDTYHSLLVMGFLGWAEHGTTGYYVLNEGMTYDEALNAANKARPVEPQPHREDPRNWRNAETRVTFSESDEDYDY